MSRGLGRVERALLDEIEAKGGETDVKAGPVRYGDGPYDFRTATRAEQESRRRAARSLAAKGLAVIIRDPRRRGRPAVIATPRRAAIIEEGRRIGERQALEARIAAAQARLAVLEDADRQARQARDAAIHARAIKDQQAALRHEAEARRPEDRVKHHFTTHK